MKASNTMRRFKLQGLQFVGIVDVPAKTNQDLADHWESFSLGDGLWSIEVYSEPAMSEYDPPCIKEFCGTNGTRDGEECDDLWGELNEWLNEVIKPAYSYKEYEAPDGTRGSFSHFQREVARGRLHGLIVCF